MIAIDANLLVHAHVTSYAQHEAARAWLEEQLVRAPRVGLQNDVLDAHLAALAVEHGLRLATSDSGFARFSGLDWFNPLQPS